MNENGSFGSDDLRVVKLCDESRLINDLRKICGSSEHRLDAWKELNQILSAAVRVHLNHDSDVRNHAKSAVEYLLHESQLSALWDEITSVYCTKSESAAYHAAVQVTNAYRTMANFFDHFTGFTMDSKTFSESIAKSLLRYVGSVNQEETKIEAVAGLILLFPLDFQAMLFAFMIRDKGMGTNLIGYLPSKFALQIAYLYLRRKYSNRRRSTGHAEDGLELSADEQSALSKLVVQALKDSSPAAVVDTLLMQRAFTASVAEFIVSLLPQACYVYVLSEVGTLWGEKLFISKGDERAQEYMTATLISTLRRISGGQLSQRCNDGFPIASILSSGVSAYLDQSDAKSRIRGMRIAKEFSILLGQDINFEELEEEDRKIAQQLSVASVVSSGTPSSTVSKVTVTQSVAHSSGYDDDSSDSEIEGYDMPDEDVEDVITLTNYLGVCLDQLLCQDNDKDAHDKQLSALLSIPKIILTSPMDAGNMCGPLVKELLRLNNSYNTKNFEGLRSEAVLSIAVAYPLFAVPVLTWALEEESYSLSVKIFAISCLTKAAYSLSNSPDERGSNVNTTSTSTSSSTSASTLTTSGKTALKKGNKSDTISTNENNPSSIIKRPAKLALSHKKVTYFVNKFGPLGPIFFYPILRLISIEIVRNSSKSITTSNKKVDNKLKLSLFSTDLDAVDEKFLDFFSKNGLYGSSGKIPEMKKCVDDDDDGDGLHSMVPTEALLALGTFCKCSVNSVYQSTFSMEIMKAAFLMKDMTSLSIRRASLIALYYALESWIHMKKNKKHFSPPRVSSVLESLTDVTGQQDRGSSAGQAGALDKEEYGLVASVVDWAVLTSKQDADESCRALKLQIVRFGIEGFGLLENDRPT